jgi:AcrR family transcriptional regulator
MDRRQRKTRNAIFHAFSKLLSTKHYNHISVQDIIDEADVGRTTFYAHFQTKDDLLNQMCEDIFDHVFSAAKGHEDTHDFSARPETLRNELTHLLYHLKDRQSDISSLLAGESNDIFLKYFKKQLAKVFSWTEKLFPEGVPAEYAKAFYVTSFAEMVSLWVKNNFRETPEEIIDYYFRLIRE